MVRKAVIFGLVAVVLVAAAGVAAASPWGAGFRGFGPAKGPMPACGNLVQELNLTDEQLARIREIEAAAFEKLQGLRSQMFRKMFELRSLYWQKSPDQAAIEAKRAELNELREQINAIQKQMRDDLKAVLTEEQLAKIGQMRGPGRGKGKFMGPGGFKNGGPRAKTGTTAGQSM